MIADIYGYVSSQTFDYATIFIDTQEGLFGTPTFENIQIDNLNAITFSFKVNTNSAHVGEHVLLRNLKDQSQSIFVDPITNTNTIFCKVKACNRIAGNMWRYELINMEWLRLDFSRKCTYKIYTEVGRIGYFNQTNKKFVPEFVYPYSQDITKAPNLVRYTKERQRLNTLNSIAKDFCSTQNVFNISYTKDPTASSGKLATVIQYLYCKFIPDITDGGYSSITLGGTSDDVDNSIEFQVNYYDRGLTDTTENITTMLVIPFLTSESETVKCYLKNPKDNTTMEIPRLRKILGSPNLVSSFILPFAPFWASTTAEWSTSGSTTVTFTINTDNVGCVPDTKSKYYMGTVLGTQINGGAGLRSSILTYKLMDYLDPTRVDKNASVVFEFLGEKLPFTIELCERFEENYFEYISFEFMFSMDNLILRIMQFDGTFKDYALNSKYLLLTDAWQDYLAQNKNYKDTLYNIQKQTLDEQYTYEREKLNQQLNAERFSFSGKLSDIQSWSNSLTANIAKHFTQRSSQELSGSYDKYQRPFLDLDNAYSTQVQALSANYDATLSNIKNTPTTIENSIFPIDLLSQWQISVNVLKYPQQFFKVKWTYGTPSTENTALVAAINGDASKLYPPQIVMNSQRLPIPTNINDSIAMDFIRDYEKSGYMVFDSAVHMRNFTNNTQNI